MRWLRGVRAARARTRGGLTVGDAEDGAGVVEVVLEEVVDEAEDGDEDLEEDPDGEEEAAAALVDHPMVESAAEGAGAGGAVGGGRVAGGVHEPLDAPALGLVTLEVGRAAGGVEGEVGVVAGGPPVCKVEARRAIAGHYG